MRVSRYLPAALTALTFLSTDLAAQVTISEFMASNRSFLADEDREFPDWLELYNHSEEAVNLEGWTLSDDIEVLDKWVLPAVVLGPKQFRVIFVSGKDRREPDGELHTNFALERNGESLVLAEPGPRFVAIYRDFPQQYVDSSYGYQMDIAVAPVLEAPDIQAKYFVAENSDLDDVWMNPDFDDAAWSTGSMPFGFDVEDPPAFPDLIATDTMEAMEGQSRSLFLRIPFEVTPEDIEAGSLQLRVTAQYKDGFIAYVNGVEVAAVNTTTSRRYNARAATPREPGVALQPDSVILPGVTELLEAGTNVLAIQALKQSRSADAFFFSADLEAFEVTEVRQVDPLYFEVPTPGAPNSVGVPAIADPPTFSRDSGAVTEEFPLELSGPEGAEIRFTMDGSEPGRGSDLYVEPITIDTTVTVRARTFQDGLLPSLPATKAFVFLQSSVAQFDSNLPPRDHQYVRSLGFRQLESRASRRDRAR